MNRRTIWLLALLTVVSLASACATPASESMAPAAAPTSAPAARASAYGASADSNSASEGKAAAGSTAPSSSAAAWDRKLIRTSVVAMTVKDVEQTLSSIRDIARTTESYVASSQTQFVGDEMTASVTLQVPAQAFDDVIQQVRKLAVKVDSEQTSSQDVTQEYVDLESQINNLKATEQSEVRLLDKATSMSDIIAIQRELTTVRGQIEQAQGRLNYLQRRSDYSTLTIKLTPESAAQAASAALTWQPLQTVARAWRASLETVSGIADALIAVVVFLWWLLPFVVLGIWLWRRRRRGVTPTQPSQPEGSPPAAGS